ncbi:hypothetical protein VQ056_31255 [Paenibacillus sp. JTLBN-2024]
MSDSVKAVSHGASELADQVKNKLGKLGEFIRLKMPRRVRNPFGGIRPRKGVGTVNGNRSTAKAIIR